MKYHTSDQNSIDFTMRYAHAEAIIWFDLQESATWSKEKRPHIFTLSRPGGV